MHGLSIRGAGNESKWSVLSWRRILCSRYFAAVCYTFQQVSASCRALVSDRRTASLRDAGLHHT